MEHIVDLLGGGYTTLQQAGPIIFVPLVMLVTGLCLGIGFMKASKAAITVGVGFISVNLTLAIVWDTLGPVTNQVVERFGLQLDVLDISWPAAAGMSFTSLIGALIIPLILLVNILMLALGVTRTINVDIWNYWHYAISGALTAAITGSLAMGFVEAACHAVISLKLADITARRLQKELGIPGVSITQSISVAFTPLILALDRLYDRIPFLEVRESKKDLSDNRYFRYLSEPAVMGFVIGFLLGVLAQRDLMGSAIVAMNLAALLLILPQSVKIIMDGLLPISQAAKKLIARRFAGRKLYMGLDSAVVMGHPNTQAAGMVLIPITILLAFLLPGNRTMPVGDLAAITFFVAMVAPLHHGNLRRSVITGTAIMALILLISTFFAPYYTAIAHATGGVAIPEGTATVTSLSIANPITFLLCRLLSLGTGGVLLALLATAAVAAACKGIERRQTQNESEQQP